MQSSKVSLHFSGYPTYQELASVDVVLLIRSVEGGERDPKRNEVRC
jgi:hypothetical protein